MTTLYVGMDSANERVVVRVLKPECASDKRLREHFLHGAEILARLDHPNVVRLIEAGLCDETAYMALEYIEGQSMRSLLQGRSMLLRENHLSMLRQMAAALTYVHLAGYWHLDFKPENILIRPDGLVVLVDFDLALERRHKVVKLNPLPGTFSYLPPETIKTHYVGDQTDIYAFGVTGYELLSGHKPFEGNTLEESRRLQLDALAPIRKLRQAGVQVHPAIENVVFKSLAYDTAARYPSMSLALRDLETAL